MSCINYGYVILLMSLDEEAVHHLGRISRPLSKIKLGRLLMIPLYTGVIIWTQLHYISPIKLNLLWALDIGIRSLLNLPPIMGILYVGIRNSGLHLGDLANLSGITIYLCGDYCIK